MLFLKYLDDQEEEARGGGADAGHAPISPCSEPQ